MQFSLLARQSDLLKLRACDISECMLDDRPALCIRFRTSKTDPSFKGALSYLVKVGGDLCSYGLVKAYFAAYGFKFGSSEITDSSFLFPRSQSVGNGQNRLLYF